MTNLHRGRLRPEQILALVRAHGASENHGNWTVDVIWDEESQVWCGHGVGIQMLGWLRFMAYHVVSLLRCRSVRRREQTRAEKRSWQECGDVLFLLICHVGRHLFPPRPATAGI